MRELRNFEVHLQSSRLSPTPITFLFPAVGDPATLREHRCDAWVMQQITQEEFGRLWNARFYSPGDVRAMLAWLNEAQRQWGLYELVRRAIVRYAELLD